jgi:hypothetical protein
MDGWAKKRKRVQTWQIAIAFIVLLLSSTYFLRQNNLKMVELRNAVIAADERGTGVKESIEALNQHVFKHMNTKIVRPIELIHTYNRQTKAAIEGSRQIGSPEAYNQATQLCQSRGIPASSLAQCAIDYLVGTGQATGQNAPELPDKNLFIYSFASPRWTPDLAGWSVLLTGVSGLWLLARLIEFIIIRTMLRRRIKSGF